MRVVHAGCGGGGGTGSQLCKRVVEMVAPDVRCVSLRHGEWHRIAVVQAVGHEWHRFLPLGYYTTCIRCHRGPSTFTQPQSGANCALWESCAQIQRSPAEAGFRAECTNVADPEGPWPRIAGHRDKSNLGFSQAPAIPEPPRTSAIVHSTQNPALVHLPTRCLAPAPRDTFLTVAM